MILVTGATGKVGGALIEALGAAHAPVRAVGHSDKSAAVLAAHTIEVARADYQELDSFDALFDGIEQFFLLTPISPPLLEIESVLIDKARTAGVQHIVKLSQYDTGGDTELLRMHRAVESYLKNSGVNYTILQPNFFFQNFGINDAPTVIQNAAIFAPIGTAQISFIDVRDVAAVAVAALTQAGHARQIYELTGSEAITYEAVAAALSKRLGKPIQHLDISLDEFRQSLSAAGVPAWFVNAFIELFADYRSGSAARTNTLVQQITGMLPRTLDNYLDDTIQAFQ